MVMSGVGGMTLYLVEKRPLTSIHMYCATIVRGSMLLIMNVECRIVRKEMDVTNRGGEAS